MLETFTPNFKSVCRAVTCDCHGDFKILTFSVDETQQSAWIWLHCNVSTNKIEGSPTYWYSRLKSGPPKVVAISRSGASARTNGRNGSWTTPTDHRRAGPPAFRRQYREKPKTHAVLTLDGHGNYTSNYGNYTKIF